MKSLSTFRCSRLLMCMMGLVSSAEADVTLELRLPSTSVVAGLPVPVDIYAIAADQTVGRLEAVIQWNPDKLSLDSSRVDPPSPTNPWQLYGFSGGGLNSDFSDGNALFAAAAVPCQTLLATSGGKRVATIYFTALEPTTPTTSVEILASLTQASITYNTQVWDKLSPLGGCGGVLYPTVPLGPPVTLTIFACINDTNCVDGNACTDDACESGICTSTPNYTVGVECCNPGPGANGHGTPAGGLEIINDGSSCTIDSCNASTGFVTHTPLVSGTACDSHLNSACAPTHTCDAVGVCQPNYAQSGNFCDDEDECTQSSACDGAGNCIGSNFRPNGTTCDDGDDCTQNTTCLNGNCQGGSSPCPPNKFCNPDAYTSTGVTCTTPPDTCPAGQSCINFTGIGLRCALPYRCDSCSQATVLEDCSHDGDCLLPECVGGVCLDDRSPSDAVCQDSSYCNGQEFCNMQNGACQPAVNPNPCSGTPSTPICDEAGDRCVECLTSIQCDDDPCLIEVCNSTLKECEPNPAPVDCSNLNDDCLIGVCQAVGGCTATPVELVECVVPADCSYYEPTRYSCILGFCTNNCDDGEDCTANDRCESGLCEGDPPVTDGPVHLVWVPTTQAVDINDSFSVDLKATKNSGSGVFLNAVEVLIEWDPDIVALMGRMDPCTADPCPAGQYNWEGAGSFFPIGGFDVDGINTPCGGANPPCPGGHECINGLCNDGDAYLLAQRRLGDPIGAPVTTANPLWITTVEFRADFPTALAGTDIDVTPCIASMVTRIVQVDSGAILTGTLGTTNVVIACLLNADCNDGNACTTDVCQANSTCLSTPNYSVGIECCNPATGTKVLINDGNDCTMDSCNPATGVVSHTPRPAGTSCGLQSNTDCDNPDTCNATGTCLANNEPDGFACTSDSNDCTNDICASAFCTHPFKPSGSACGSASDTDCDNPNTCNGTGTCLPNNEPNGLACTPDSNDCTNDICGSGICTHPNRPSGFACGDQSTNTTCDGLDTCNGTGTCLDNLAPTTTPCGSQTDTECSDPDRCDGNGNCDPKNAASGIACDDGVFCNGLDACNGSGVCLHDGPPCSICECITAGDCSSGACVPCVNCIDASSDICESETQCPCDAPIVVSAGARYLGVTPLPVNSGQPMKIRVTSPQFPCLSKYVSGPKRCGGTGALCASQANCNQCSIGGDPCLSNPDCGLPGEVCVISGLQCVPSPVVPFDINNDGSQDGMLATLADNPADAAELTPAEWGATLKKCSLSYATCTVDTDCNHGICIHAGCGSQVCDTPCSVSAQNCSKFCDDPPGTPCTTSANCAPGGTCIAPTCQRDETCIPGRVYITGPDIVPSDGVAGGGITTPRSYSVVIDCGGETAPVTRQMRRWCDVDGNGVVNFSDIQMNVFAFQGTYGRGNGIPNVLTGCDLVGLTPCNPEQVPNFNDINAQVLNFSQAIESYTGRLDAGTCANAKKCSVSLQNCTDGSTCVRSHNCEIPCVP